MSIFCNICVDVSDLDIILSRLSVLKTKIADWVETKKNENLLTDQLLGLHTNVGTFFNLADIDIEHNITSLTGTEEQFQHAYNVVVQILNEINAET